MKLRCTRLLFASLLAALGVLTAGSAAFAAPSHLQRPASGGDGDPVRFVFLHVATEANITDPYLTELDDLGVPPTLLQDPNTIFFATATRTPTPGGGMAPLFPHPVGVGWDPFTKHWGIWYEDLAPMAVGAAFYVLGYSPEWGGLLIHHTTSANTVGSQTALDDYAPGSFGDPRYSWQVIHRWDPLIPVSDPHPLGVWYNPGTQLWTIIHTDGTPIPLGAEYDVAVTGFSRHTATSANSSLNSTILDIAGLNGNPFARVLVTPVQGTLFCLLTPIGGQVVCNPAGPFDTSPLAVGYNSLLQRWMIFNADGATLAPNTSFNLYYL